MSGALKNRERFPFLRFETLPQATRAPGTAAPYFLVSVPPEKGQAWSAQKQRYAAVFQFRHTPHDAVVLIIEKRNENWVVVNLDWFAE